MGLLNFYETPRVVGNPFQTIVHSEFEINEFVSKHIGQLPIFTSHNSYPTLNGTEPHQINVNKLFLDFDSKKKPENAKLDTIKLLDFCDEHKLAVFPVFSGSKGFHSYIALKPQKYLYGQYLKDCTKAIHFWLKKTLSLRTLDLMCSEPRRLCRMWYTPHVTANNKGGEGVKNGLYCCPLYPEWVRKWNMDEITTYAQSPTLIDYNPTGILYTLEEFIEYFKIDVRAILKESFSAEEDEEGSTVNKITKYTPVTNDFVVKVLPKPCLHNQIVNNPNPPHVARFATVIHFKQLGYSRKWIFDFFQAQNYADNHRKDVCAYQINQIFDHKPDYYPPSCEKLFRGGICVGDKCEKFEAFKRRAHIIC